MSNVNCQLSNVNCQMSNVKCQRCPRNVLERFCHGLGTKKYTIVGASRAQIVAVLNCLVRGPDLGVKLDKCECSMPRKTPILSCKRLGIFVVSRFRARWLTHCCEGFR